MRPHRGSQKAIWSLAVSDTPWLRELLISTTHINKPLCGIVNVAGTGFSQRYLFAGLAACSILGPLNTWCDMLHASWVTSMFTVSFTGVKNEWNVSAHIFTLSCGSVYGCPLCQQACLILSTLESCLDAWFWAMWSHVMESLSQSMSSVISLLKWDVVRVENDSIPRMSVHVSTDAWV